MKIFKLLLLAALGLNLAACAAAQTGERQTNKNGKPKNAKPMNEKPKAEPTGENVKIIAEGFYESLDAPFIFVARSLETYAQLQKIFAQKLPPASEIDFAKSAVVAAFAGTKNTGGYSVSVVKTGDKITVGLNEPPKDAMTTDALTTPFAIALVSIEGEKTLPIEVSENWKKTMQTYRVVSGKFETSGGIAGRLQKFDAAGTISILSFGDYATLFFNLSGKGADASGMRLTETASGAMKNGKIELARLDAGSFSVGPKPPLKVSGMLSNDKISLTFEPLPAIAADGFQTGGKLEAVKIKR
jgi:hypothetical protein